MKNYFFIYSLIFVFSVQGQTIDSIVFFPQNPTVDDTVTILCYVQYPNVGCLVQEKESNYGTNNSIFLKAFHCMGMINMICYTIDTFIVPMPKNYPGTYTVHYMPGYIKEYPCTFPIDVNGDTIPYPFAIYSGEIVVSPSVSANHKTEKNLPGNIFPNPTNGYFSVNGNYFFPITLNLYDFFGRAVINKIVYSNNEKISVDMLLDGIYSYCIEDSNKKINWGKLAVWK